MIPFWLGRVKFDEEEGPTLVKSLFHNIHIPEPVLSGVTTTLFTMAIGVGEPTGESDTAIIPVNVTLFSGRCLIFSYSVTDEKARSGARMESFMLYCPREYQDRLLDRIVPLVDVFQEEAELLKHNDRKSVDEIMEGLFDKIREILETEIDQKVEMMLNTYCTKRDRVLVGGKRIYGIHNIGLSYDLIESVFELNKRLNTIKRNLPFESALKDQLFLHIDLYATTEDETYFMNFLFQKDKYVILVTSDNSRISHLHRPFLDILWHLVIEYQEDSDSEKSHTSDEDMEGQSKEEIIILKEKRHPYIEALSNYMEKTLNGIESFAILGQKNEHFYSFVESNHKMQYYNLAVLKFITTLNRIFQHIIGKEAKKFTISLKCDEGIINNALVEWLSLETKEVEKQAKLYLLVSSSQYDQGTLSFAASELFQLRPRSIDF